MIFDIETTGLSPTKHAVILIGCITFNDRIAIVHQFFAEHIDQEKDILEAFISLSASKEIILNFNGSSFDIPYLNKRFRKHQFTYRIHPKQSFDLYRICKSAKLDVPNYKLKTLEGFLGISRDDTISGRESIRLYYDYMNHGNEKARSMVLGHNYEDILHLIPFLRILDHLDQASIRSHLPYGINLQQQRFYLSQWQLKSDFLELSFSIANTALYRGKELAYFRNYTLQLKHGEMHIQLPVFQIVTPDMKTYVFADAEDLGWVQDFNTLSYEEKLHYLVKEDHRCFYSHTIQLVETLLKSLDHE